MGSRGQNPPQWNQTTLVDFILLGFSDIPDLQGFLFGVFLIMYTIILMGNSLIIIITKMDPSLQTPMYFFLGNFSSLEICYVSVTGPRLLIDLCSQNRNIPFLACAAQMYFFLTQPLRRNKFFPPCVFLVLSTYFCNSPCSLGCSCC